MDCATEMVTLPVSGMPAPCTPSPQPGDKTYSHEGNEIPSMWERVQSQTDMQHMKGTLPYIPAVQEVYSQYYSVPGPNGTQQYPQPVMCMPMAYYQQYRGVPAYAFEYPAAPAPQQPTPKAQVETPTIVKTPGRQRVVIWSFCQFCQNNKESESYYRSHILRDAEGRVVCPVLRAYNCPICNNGGGDDAHTKSYCPKLRTSRLPRRGNMF